MTTFDHTSSDSAILPMGNRVAANSKPSICVSIGRGRHRMMIAERNHLSEKGANLVEFRLDYIRRPVNFSRLMDGKSCHVIATCRRTNEGGRWERSENDRLGLLRTAIAADVEYIDLEYDIAEQIPRYGKTKRIISYHNFEETPPNLAEIYRQLLVLDPDVIKIVTRANQPNDNFATLRLCRDSKVPTVAFCMGEMGLPSRVLCGKFGAPFSYAAFNRDRQIAPGQLSYKQMVRDFHFTEISKTTKVLGVVADPVAHSLSPRIHNAAIRNAKLDMVYLPFRVPSEHLESFVEQCREFGVIGLSVTIPHKEKALKTINVLDESVVGIRACNTIVFNGRDAMGYNTDCKAAIESIQQEIRVQDEDHPFEGIRFLVMGAGGVARSIAYGLKRFGGTVHITSRDYRKSDQLAASLRCKSLDWPGRANHDCDVVINATPLGMSPNMNESPFEEQWFDSHQIAFDCVYNPEQTLFIKQARAAGCRTITGVDMFVRQAMDQFKLFTDRDADPMVIRKEIKKATSPAKFG